MINEDIRNIIEPELHDGEELLWAERTSEKVIKAYAKDVAKDDKLRNRINFVGYTGALVMVLVDAQMRTFFFPLFILLSLLWYYTYRNSETELEALDRCNVGGYALTNLRFFEFDKKLDILTSKDSTKLKKIVEEPNWIRLSPIGGGVLNTFNVRFLANNYVTTNFLQSQIKK